MLNIVVGKRKQGKAGTPKSRRAIMILFVYMLGCGSVRFASSTRLCSGAQCGHDLAEQNGNFRGERERESKCG